MKEGIVGKRRSVINERTIKERLKEGRGQGRGASYKPWLCIQDVPSQGLVTRVKGWKTDRCHHLLSKLECQYFYILEWSPMVCDIREQFPLELNETLDIAKRLGVPHPANPRTRQPIIMTTDFVNTIDQAGKLIDHARSIKYSQELSSDRTLEKLEIERRYWSEREVDWGIVTEHEVEQILAANVSWVHVYRDASALSPTTDELIRRVETRLTPQVNEQRSPLRDLTDACDDQLGLSPGTSLSIVRHLIANRRWQVDMMQAIDTSQPLVLLSPAPCGKKAGKR